MDVWSLQIAGIPMDNNMCPDCIFINASNKFLALELSRPINVDELKVQQCSGATCFLMGRGVGRESC